jgi:arginine N-succinyltransferase
MTGKQDNSPGASIRIRPLGFADLDALMRLAEGAGPGLTNLPPDREALGSRLARSEKLLRREAEGGAILLGLEVEGRIRGCGMIFPRVGVEWPFYSYRIGHMTQRSSIDGRMLRFQVLTLTNDLEDCAEVGGLVIDPGLRGGGYGRAIARSRYLFIAQHRASFGARVIADLRGWLDKGRSPFWDAVGGRFYSMDFDEADRINGTTGNQFIADLGPRNPIYVNMLAAEAQAVIGRVHGDGTAALNLLIEEGFRDEGYVDIFDAGPTMIAPIDGLKAVSGADTAIVMAISDTALHGSVDALVCTGLDARFRSTRAMIGIAEDGVTIDRGTADVLGIAIGDSLTHCSF